MSMLDLKIHKYFILATGFKLVKKNSKCLTALEVSDVKIAMQTVLSGWYVADAEKPDEDKQFIAL